MVGWSDFYTDRFATTGLIPIENEDGSTSMVNGEILSNIACRISYKNNDKNDGKSVDGNFKSTTIKIFTEPNIRVSKGDKVKADRVINNVVVDSYRGISGQPSYHDDHLEFILEDNGGA